MGEFARIQFCPFISFFVPWSHKCHCDLVAKIPLFFEMSSEIIVLDDYLVIVDGLLYPSFLMDSG